MLASDVRSWHEESTRLVRTGHTRNAPGVKIATPMAHTHCQGRLNTDHSIAARGLHNPGYQSTNATLSSFRVRRSRCGKRPQENGLLSDECPGGSGTTNRNPFGSPHVGRLRIDSMRGTSRGTDLKTSDINAGEPVESSGQHLRCAGERRSRTGYGRRARRGRGSCQRIRTRNCARLTVRTKAATASTEAPYALREPLKAPDAVMPKR